MSYEFRAVLRSRWILGYALFFFAMSEGLLRFGGDASKALVSLLNVVMLIIPLMSVVFGTITIYNSRDMTELLLSQPVERRTLFSSMYLGLVLPLAAAFALGVSVPFVARLLVFDAGDAAKTGFAGVGITLLGTGVLLTCIMVGLAFMIATRFDDKAFGLGAALLVWLVMAVLYDALLMLCIWIFRDYPLEMPVLALSMLNPIDLGRVLIMLKFDVAALMGYTGAVFERFFGTAFGSMLALVSLLVWVIVPFWFGVRGFERKNL